MVWLFALVGLVMVVVIGLVVVGRETARLSLAPKPAVFDLGEAVAFIADRLPPDTQARISHDDVRWVLLTDADLLEERSLEPRTQEEEDDLLVVDEEEAVARIIAAAESAGRDIADVDIVAVLDGRADYLEAIGAVGPQA